MTASVEPLPGGQQGQPAPEEQAALRHESAASADAGQKPARGWLRSGVRGSKAMLCYLFSPALRSLSIAAILLAAIALFSRPWELAGDNAGRLDALEASLQRIETRLGALGLSSAEGKNPTTLLVAVQFVTAAAERSAPFDTALAVAISMTGEHPKIGPLLDELLTDATTGVPSLEDLRADFQTKLTEFEKQGLFTGGGEASGSGFGISRLLGFGEPEISAEHQATLQKLRMDVANHNLSQAAQLIAKLDGRIREGLEGWREKAQRRVAVNAVLTELRRAAFIDVIDKAS
jgi:hypothetical protein